MDRHLKIRGGNGNTVRARMRSNLGLSLQL